MNIKNILRNNMGIYQSYLYVIQAYNKLRYKLCKTDEQRIALIKSEYKRYTKMELSWPPILYTEKIQYSKLFDSNREKSDLTDKWKVREWVKERIGEEYLIPLLGVWNAFEDINFDNLPDKFVLKTNHASATNVIVENKRELDTNKTKKKFNFWMKLDFAYAGKGFEMHYSDINPKIIAEEYIVDSNGELNDYKFLCFNGQPYFCWVDVGRHNDHRRNVYNMKWELQDWRQFSYLNTDAPLSKPQNFEKMIEIAGMLSKGFAHVRVDLYNVDGKIYFGEMTFTNGKGYELIIPESANKMLGDLWDL